ncbi:MAG TPA: hypothetical protein VH092_24230 [Urbifossiella sp.]|nr:hypothetical protein [Urbifossiella sp.]
MSEPYQTMTEIEQRYPNEWVLIDQPKFHRAEAVGGYVLFHSPDRAAFDHRLGTRGESGHPLVASLYTGTLTRDEADLESGEPR